jgi:hypothetical protein
MLNDTTQITRSIVLVGALAAVAEAIASKQWQAVNPSPVIEVSSSPDGDGGLNLPSAGIGAAVPLSWS